MMNRATILQHATDALRVQADSPRLDAEILLAHVLRCSRSTHVAHADSALAPPAAAQFAALIEQRKAGVPVAYLTGVKEFWSLPLAVNEAVLIPRPETEMLVERALGLLPNDTPARVLEVGTGSGAIALALAHERPRASITATDISAPALAVARANAAALRLTHIRWLQGSWFEPVANERFDVILSNPPYLADDDAHLPSLCHEPRAALTAGVTGLEAYHALIPQAHRYLTPRGWLLFEHGAGQAPAIAQIFHNHQFRHVRTHTDYAGNSRVTLATVHS